MDRTRYPAARTSTNPRIPCACHDLQRLARLRARTTDLSHRATKSSNLSNPRKTHVHHPLSSDILHLPHACHAKLPQDAPRDTFAANRKSQCHSASENGGRSRPGLTTRRDMPLTRSTPQRLRNKMKQEPFATHPGKRRPPRSLLDSL